MKKRQDSSKQKYDYIPLTPKEDIKEGNEYFNALDWALTHGKVKNIALAGPYGSGKSSIIDSFLSHRPGLKCLRIAMATFIENAIEDAAQQKKEESDQTESTTHPDGHIHIPTEKIEEGILRQLFYKVDHARIPQSRFRKLHKLSFSIVYFWVLFIAFLSIIGAYVFCKDSLIGIATQIAEAGHSVGLNLVLTKIITVFLLAILSVLLARLVHFVCTRFRIKGGSVSGTNASAEVTSSENDSALDKHMDEIVYFFEETKYRIVVFEDLDRLNEPTIFVRLRELNTILNNCDTLKHPIIFVYAVRDDIFKDADRTKFFDFIIPVVPIINSTNSSEELQKMLDKFGNHSVSTQFVEDVAPYISDMRTLINVFNEFIVYKNTIIQQQELQLSDEKMLALIIFKNLYPHDFANIQREEGIIKDAFQNRGAFITQQLTILDKSIADYAASLAGIHAESLNSTREIKASMLSALSNWKGRLCYVCRAEGYNPPQIKASTIMDDAFSFDKLLVAQNWKVVYFPWGDQSTQALYPTDFCEIASSYYTRYRNYALVEEQRVEDLRKEIATLRQQRMDLSARTLASLINEFGGSKVLPTNVLTNSLLVFLLRNGYIDEQYASYINYFKGTSVTIGDQNFILAIKNQTALPFEYPLVKMDQLMQRLHSHDFKQKTIYNYALLNHLLTSDKYDDKLEVMMNQLSDGTSDSWKFIDGFCRQTSQHARLISLLAPKWKGMWDTVYSDVTQSFDRQLFYFRLLVEENNTEALVAMNEKGNISTFIVDHPHILQQLEGIESHKIISLIQALDVKFTRLETYRVSCEVLDCIFDGDYYVLNYDMIQCIVTQKAPNLTADLAVKNYSALERLGYEPLLSHVHANLADYVQNIILTDSNTQEDVVCIVQLLHHLITDISLCDRVIAHQHFELEQLSSCCRDLLETNHDEILAIWNSILAHNKVKASWQNAMVYWNSFALTDELSDWLANHSELICASDCNCVTSDFIRELIQSDLDNTAYRDFLKILHVDSFEVELSNVSTEKVEILIALQYFPFTASFFDELHASHPVLCIKFVIANLDKHDIIVDELKLDDEHLEQLIISNQVTLDLKTALLEKYGSLHMTQEIALYLTRTTITIDIPVFKAAWKHLNPHEKSLLMLRYMDILDADGFEMCFSEIGGIYAHLADRSRRHEETLELTPQHSRLARRLESVGYISSQKIKQIASDSKQRQPSNKQEIAMWIRQNKE